MILQKVIKVLADLKLAIFLLILICFCCVVGSIIEQDKSFEYYTLNYPKTNPLFGFFDYQFINFFGLNYLFKTFWFVALLVLFGSSLLSCTFLQQLPSFDFSRSLNFTKLKNSKQESDISRLIPQSFLPKLLGRLQKENYFLFQKGDSFYAYKGIIGRLGPILVHFSIILILLGSIFAALMGFMAQEIIPKSEIFYIQNSTEGSGFHFLPDIPIRVNDFWIDYNIKNNFISQFYSNLSLLKFNGQELVNQTISVNNPIETKGIVWYQTDWDIIGLRLKINNLFYEFPLTQLSNTTKKIWISWVPISNDFNDGIIFIVDNLRGSLLKYKNIGEFDSIVELGQSISAQTNLKLIVLDIISSTGLQIKFDPGIFLIYLGFGLLIVSTLLSYASYSKVWIIKDGNDFRVLSTANRSKLQFEIQFLKIFQNP